MDLSIYNVILGPVVSDKAYKLNSKLKKLTLWVHPFSNKPMVKEAFKKLFNVEVETVRILVRAGKVRRVGRKLTTGITRKKAIVTLAEGYSLDLFDQTGTGIGAGERVATVDEKN
jgi:large subunit ribosomal protein L23